MADDYPMLGRNVFSADAEKAMRELQASSRVIGKPMPIRAAGARPDDPRLAYEVMDPVEALALLLPA
jgi:hypothetical protein